MSFLGRGTSPRGMGSKVFVTVMTLAAFQVLAVIGAGVASAVTGCTYNPATQTINITIDPGEFAGVAVEGDLGALDAESPDGAILFDNNGLGFENGAVSTQCGSASNTNTVSIVVLGSPSADEAFYIDNESGAQFATTITWAADLGSNTIGGVDTFLIFGSEDSDDTVVLTNGTFTLNGGGGPLLGVELDEVFGDAGNDTIDGSALTTPILIAFGESGDDTISPGTQATLPFALGFGEFLDGGAGAEVNGDTLSYATRTTSVVIDSTTGTSGHSANVDCDVVDAGDEEDLQSGFENLQTGSGGDCIVGLAGVFEYFIPGDGDDTVTGQLADGDTIDWSSSSALMTITPSSTCGGTATGQGTDTWTTVDAFVGSSFDDVLIWNATCPTSAFSGGDGIDTVDATATTTGQVISLDALDPTNDDLENLFGGSGNDVLDGNDIRNLIEGNDGNDDLFGDEGNDVLIGGLGNDDYEGGLGADTVSFATNTVSGVNVDVILGFATSSESGDDSFTDAIEIIHGSPFADTITGGGGFVTTNFLFTGGAGADILTGSGSNDTLKGGGGDDIVRASGGDDTLFGAGGDDLLVGGQGFDIAKGGKGDDVCKGVEHKTSCGSAKHPRKPSLATVLAAKLV